MKSLWDHFYDFTGWLIRNDRIPDEYLATSKTMDAHSTFSEYFATLGIKHFTAGEFTSYFHTTRRGVTNHEPPSEMWGNIVPTIRIVDQLRELWGRPIVLLSSYRSPAYNAACPGAASGSFHQKFQALDIAVSGKTPRQVFDQLADWRTAGKFKGGLGLYSTFTHIDTRGYNATWGT